MGVRAVPTWIQYEVFFVLGVPEQMTLVDSYSGEVKVVGPTFNGLRSGRLFPQFFVLLSPFIFSLIQDTLQ